ncbi:SulP family inorganic anion transporter [Clostridium minihomine]|uniref:SulP family inorganic anion transporter n=1 Tax=Clostridium minihomine TaxID=2045012 RepID=UPI000C790834|nr:SulP family inorganic anion transporter [Clostridium minihomine]
MFHLVTDYATDLKREFHGYGPGKLRKDFLSGITVAAVALPLALAFGVGSGADAAAGLITAIISAFVISALSGASFQISGPTGAMTAILVPLAARYGLNTLFAASLLAGLLLILAGLFRLGNLVYFLPSPVISGFTSGIAVIIALGQVGNLFGVPLTGENALGRVVHLFQGGFSPNWYALGIGLFVITLMAFWPKKWGSRVPGSLAGVIAATVLAVLLELPVDTVGAIPQTLVHSSRLTIGSLTQMQLDVILLPAVSIAVLCMIESLLCGAAGGRMKGERMNADRELVAQGVGNLILPFLGGVPATAAIARTSVAIKSGCQTRLTGVIQGVVLLLSMFLLSPFMSRIPMAALAGVLMVTAWRMNEWESIRYLFSHKFKGAISKFVLTMLTTVLFDLTIAIAAGVLFSIALFVVRISSLQVSVSELDKKRMKLPSEASRHIQVIYITGAVFFGSLEQLESGLTKADGDVLILSMRGVPFVDTSAVAFLLEYCQERQKEGVTILFSSIQPSVKEMLDRAGITDVVGQDSYYFNAKDAILSHLDE